MTRKYAPQNWLNWWLSRTKPSADDPLHAGNHLNLALTRRRFVRPREN